MSVIHFFNVTKQPINFSSFVKISYQFFIHRSQSALRAFDVLFVYINKLRNENEEYFITIRIVEHFH